MRSVAVGALFSVLMLSGCEGNAPRTVTFALYNSDPPGPAANEAFAILPMDGDRVDVATTAAEGTTDAAGSATVELHAPGSSSEFAIILRFPSKDAGKFHLVTPRDSAGDLHTFTCEPGAACAAGNFVTETIELNIRSSAPAE